MRVDFFHLHVQARSHYSCSRIAYWSFVADTLPWRGFQPWTTQGDLVSMHASMVSVFRPGTRASVASPTS